MRKLFILCSVAVLVLLLARTILGCQSQAEALQHNELGAQLLEEGRDDEAIAEFNKAIELDPELAIAYSNRGAAYIGKGDFDKALADCDMAIALDPLLAAAYNNRARAYHEKGELDKALARSEERRVGKECRSRWSPY